jgi:ABC-2 type transport system permease protein
MIATIFRIGWLNLRRDRVALALTFALPLAFFSFFALVFGALDDEGRSPVRTVVASEERSALAEHLIERLSREAALDVVVTTGTVEGSDARQRALEMVTAGRAAVAVVLPADMEERLRRRQTLRIELLADRSNPIAVSLVRGLLQSALPAPGGPFLASAAAPAGTIEFPVVDVLGGRGKRPSIAFFASGLGVMFLLFAASGRSALFLDERESGVLQRMLAGRLGMGQLILGRWLFLLVLGTAQVAVMFVWGSLAFGLELWTPRHLSGFLVMTLATASAAAAFGLLLSTVCRTRAQLHGLAAVIVLLLSALGGSLFPRFLMPEALQAAGLASFNTWAVAGYQKVFWYEARIPDLWPQLAVLGGSCLVFLLAARLISRRWELR